MARRDIRFQHLLDDLRRQIESAFAPGEQLPSTRDLATMHEVGTTTVQRALKQLRHDGCVRAMANVGWFRSEPKTGTEKLSDSRKTGKKLTVGLMTRRDAE